MSAAVLCIGTELTRGELLNSNSTWLAESLTRIGLEVTAIDCVDDDRGRIEAYLRRLASEHQHHGSDDPQLQLELSRRPQHRQEAP